MVSEAPVKRGRGRPRKNPIPEQQVDVAARDVGSSEQPELDKAEQLATPAALKVYIYPDFRGEDDGDGGIRRVVEAQKKWLPRHNIELVNTPAEADLIASHITIPDNFLTLYPEKPFVALNHGFYWSEYEWGNWALKANVDAMENIRCANAVIAPTEWVANNIRRHTSRFVYVIPHGVDMDEIKPMPSKGYVLWNKTRPDPICDPAPMNDLARKMPSVQFLSTFGEPGQNVALTGRLPYEQAKTVLAQAGVYLCTSRETFGIGTLEAMAAGVPVVAFDYAGQSEFITHGVDGWLARPGDIDGLAEGVRWAMANREEIGKKSRELTKVFNWDDIASAYSTIFHRTYQEFIKVRPKVSVIVTAYKLDDYLEYALRSVLDQTLQDWECIIVDDASPDRCGEIADEWAAKDSRFKAIHNSKNVYLAEARNIGIRAAKGKYVMPLDADDMLSPVALKELSGALDRDRHIHVAYGGVLFIDEKRNLINYGGGHTDGHSGWPMEFSHEQQIMQRNLLPYASMFRQEAWALTGGYRRRCRTAEDADFWTRLSSYGFRPKFVTSEDVLIYSVRENSMSHNNSADWIRWFSWAKMPSITPAGAATQKQLPIPSLDPVIISVIIPVGPGHDKIVTDAIDSVDTQSFRNWECIVVNDTGKPLETELPAWVRVIETEGKTGPAHARNVGITVSKGRLFLPLDADDYLQPDALRAMFMAYQEKPDVIYTDFWQTNADGNMSIHQCDDYDPELLTGKQRIVNGQVREGMMHSVTALTPKAAWKKIGGYDETLSAWEDWDFQLAIGNLGVCSRRIASPLFVYRKHTGFRREENYEFFEKSKEGILRKWGQLWEGGVKLMACSSCGRGRTIGPSSSPLTAPRPQNSEAVLIRYTGPKVGAVTYRGDSKTVYAFAAGDEKYVLAQDVQMFLSYGDFKVVPPTPPPASAPVLVAEGPPVN